MAENCSMFIAAATSFDELNIIDELLYVNMTREKNFPYDGEVCMNKARYFLLCTSSTAS